MLNDAIEKIPE
jgi:hypothetical protein